MDARNFDVDADGPVEEIREAWVAVNQKEDASIAITQFWRLPDVGTCACGWPLLSDGSCSDAECSYGWAEDDSDEKEEFEEDDIKVNFRPRDGGLGL